MKEASESSLVSRKEPFESQIAVSGPNKQIEKVESEKPSISELLVFHITLQENHMFFKIYNFFALVHIHLL